MRHYLVPGACAGLLGAFLALVLGPAGSASALLIRYDFRDLTQRSKYVVAGEVLDLKSYKAPYGDLGDVFFTDVRIQVEKALKGAPQGGIVTVQVLGGKVGDEGYSCRESAKYEKGEKVLVFLRDFNQRLWNTGWMQGKYRLVNGTTVQGGAGLPIAADTPLATVESWIQAYSTPPASGAPQPVQRTSGGAR